MTNDKDNVPEAHQPQATLTNLFCPKCGQSDRHRSLKSRHYARGHLCDGVPIEVVYARVHAGNEVTDQAALAELRQMFPDLEDAEYSLVKGVLRIQRTDRFGNYFQGTFTEAMQKVREFHAWKESQ